MKTNIYTPEGIESHEVDLIEEQPLSIRVQGKPYTVIMRSPGNEIDHLAGFCLGEGIVDKPSDIETIGYCGDDTNTVTVTLTSEHKQSVRDILLRSGFISQTSCGICGKEILDDLKTLVTPFANQPLVDPMKAFDCLNSLSEHQPLRAKTGAAHAAAIYDSNYSLISIAEDVGRHNALDKAIGNLFLTESLDQAFFVILSSRVSYEMVQKTARAGISSLFAISKPTSLAIDLASGLNMTVGCLARNKGVHFFCGNRLK